MAFFINSNKFSNTTTNRNQIENNHEIDYNNVDDILKYNKIGNNTEEESNVEDAFDNTPLDIHDTQVYAYETNYDEEFDNSTFNSINSNNKQTIINNKQFQTINKLQQIKKVTLPLSIDTWAFTCTGSKRINKQYKNNEDSMEIFIDNDINKLTNFNIYILADGHGPDNYIHPSGKTPKDFSKFVCEYLKKALCKYNGSFPLARNVIEQEFWHLEKLIRENEENLGEHFGTTVTIVILYSTIQNGLSLQVINLGDSQAVVSKNGLAMNISVEHKPDNPREKVRILRECMINSMKYSDVVEGNTLGGLGPSRTIGDYDTDKYFKGSIPEIFTYDLDKSNEFIIIASDGLWDFVDSQTSINFVTDCLRELKFREELNRNNQIVGNKEYFVNEIGETFYSGLLETYEFIDKKEFWKNPAKMLTKLALKRGTDDDISVIVIVLNWK